MRTEYQRSAGGLVVRRDLILLISTHEGQRWQLPKGHIEAGESTEQTAVREVREETGVTGRIVCPLPTIDYWFVEDGQRRIHKRVDFFLLTYVAGSTSDFDPNEVSGAHWFSWEDGLRSLSFRNEREVAVVARERWSSSTAAGGSSGYPADAPVPPGSEGISLRTRGDR